MKTQTFVISIAAIAAWSSLASADSVCKPTLCNGMPPAFLTTALPPVPIGREVIVPLEILGNNSGTYYPYTDSASRAEDARVIHVDLDIDSPTRREAQQLAMVRFGKCRVTGVRHTCYLSLRGVAPGTTTLAFKAFDACVNDRCPGETPRLPLHFSYATRGYSLRVGN